MPVVDEESARRIVTFCARVFQEPLDGRAAFAEMMDGACISALAPAMLDTSTLLCHELASQEPDRAGYEVSDEAARMILSALWRHEKAVTLGQAMLRAGLDQGSVRDLPAEMAEALAEARGRMFIVLSQLVSGMSAILSRRAGQGDGWAVERVLTEATAEGFEAGTVEP